MVDEHSQEAHEITELQMKPCIPQLYYYITAQTSNVTLTASQLQIPPR